MVDTECSSDRILDLLAHDSRRRLLRLLAVEGGQLSVKALETRLDRNASSLGYPLRLLSLHGFIDREQRGGHTFYFLTTRGRRLVEWMDSLAADPDLQDCGELP